MIDRLLFGQELEYLDDLDLSQMTEEQKQAFQKMLDEEPYKFYSLWRDPDAAQRHYEGDDFTTTPASELYIRIGALRSAGAPNSVIEYWKKVLETRNRPNDVYAKSKTPRTKPVTDRLAHVEAFCDYLNDYWNIEDKGPAIEDLHNPLADHWEDVMNAALGLQDNEPLHGADVRHYQDAPDGVPNGCEIVEAKFYTHGATFDLQEINEIAQCDGFEILPTGDTFTIKFFFFGCYE